MKKTITAVACAVAMAAAPAAASAATPARLAPSKVSSVDAAWVQASIQDELLAVQAAQLAETKTTRPALLALARYIISYRTKWLNNSDKTAHLLGIAIPTAPSTAQQAELTTLQGLSGLAFAQQYAADEVSEHTKFIQLTQTEIASGTSVIAKAGARYALPIDEHILSLAQTAAHNVGAPNS